MKIDLTKLFEPFPKDAVSWRAQNVKGDGTAALALAYIDARDVMNRLDDVCGIENWQRRYTHAENKTICEIGIKCGEEWVWKADGAGDTDIEAEKGAISDAFKRAAVNWGIGRYLYSMDAVWVPCEAYKRQDGKWAWKSWTVDPWTKVKPEQKAGFTTARQQNAQWIIVRDKFMAATSAEEFATICAQHETELTLFKRSDPEIYNQLVRIKKARLEEIAQEEAMKAGMSQGFNSIGASHA